MKKLLTGLFLIAFVTLFQSLTYADFNIPNNIAEDKYFRAYDTIQDNCAEFYIDGHTIHYRLKPDKYTKDLILSIERTGSNILYVHASDEGVEKTGSFDLKNYENSSSSYVYTIKIHKNNKNDTGFSLLNATLFKDSAGLSLASNTNNSSIKEYEQFYENLPPDTLEYYKTDFIGAPDDEYGKIFREKSAEITAGLETDYEKAFAIYEWVADNVYYDMDVYNGISSETGQSPVTALTEKRAVCGGYTSLTAMLLQAAGIPTRYVIGTSDGEDHAWNYVYIDGKWSFVDTTWASTNKYENGEYIKGPVNYSQFGMSRKLLSMTRKCKKVSNSVLIDDVIYQQITFGGEDCYYVEDCINEVKRDILIRDTVMGKNVRMIDSKAFDSNDIRNIYVPETVLEVRTNAFYNLTDFTVYFMGNETAPYQNTFTKCKNFTIYANSDSYIMSKTWSTWNATEFKTLDWYIDSVNYSYIKVTYNIKHGALMKQPTLVVVLYDINDRVKEVRFVETTPDTESYTLDFKGYNTDYYTKAYLIDTDSLMPYSESVRRRLSIQKISDTTFESYHCYGNNYDVSYTYTGTVKNCKNIDITFNKSTRTEEGKDYIIIYKQDGSEFGRYSGRELSGKTVCVPGKSFTVRLVSDSKNGNYYGYKIEKIVENYN